MPPEAPETGELSAKVAGQELNLKGVSLNTIATVATLVAVGVLLYIAFAHAQDSRDASSAFVGAIKEQTTAIKEATQVQREGNCLLVVKDAEQCRRITR